MSEPEILDEFERAQQSPDEFDRVKLAGAEDLGGIPEPEVAPVMPQQQVAAPEVATPEVKSVKAETPEQPPVEPLEEAVDPEPEDEKPDDSPSVAGELAMAPLRGTEAALEGVYGFLDYVTGDVLPDWDRAHNSVFGKSQTGVGIMAESVVQFGVGLIPGIGVAGGIAKVGGKLGKLTGAAKAATKSKEAMKTFAKGQLSLSPAAMKRLSKLKSGTKTQVKWATRGFFAEFLAFKGEEERLANLLTGPDEESNNAFINWLAYNPDAEDKDEWHYEAEERFKRALEGAVIGEAVGGAFLGSKAAISGLRKILGRFKKKNELVGQQVARGEEPDEFAAWSETWDEALFGPKLQLTYDEEAAIRLAAPEVEAPGYRDIDPETASVEEMDAWFLNHGEMSVARMPEEAKRGAIADILKQSKPGGTEDVLRRLGESTIKRVEDAGLFDPKEPKSLLNGLRLMGSVTEMRALLGAAARSRMSAAASRADYGKDSGDLFERTNELIQRGIEAAGGRARDINIESIRERPADMARIATEAEVLYDGMSVGAKELYEKTQHARTAMEQTTVAVKNADGKEITLNADQAITELYSAMDRFTSLQEIWHDFGSQMSLLMRQRNDLYRTGQSSIGRDIPGQHRRLGMAVEDAMSETGKRFRRENRRGVSGKRVVKDMEKLFKKSGVSRTGATGGGDMTALARGFDDVGVNRALSRYMLVGRKGLAVSQEWYYNAILGAPTSWAVNVLGGMVVQPLRHMESIAGGVASGNTDLVKANFRAMFDIQSFSDSLKYAWRSGVDDEARSISGYTAFRDDRLHTPKGEIHVDNPDGNAFYSGINFIGHVIRHPSRIMMMGDEFFKQMSYRGRIKTSLAVDGYQKGLHREPGKLAEYIHDGFEATITKGGRFRNEDNVHREALEALVKAKESGDFRAFASEKDFIKRYMKRHYFDNKLKIEDGTIYDAKGFSERELLVESGTDWALMNTFTNNVTNPFFKKTGEVATMSPWLGFVIPFVRTPSNILTFALGRTLPTGAPKEIMGSLKDTAAHKAILEDDEAMKTFTKKAFGETPEAERLALSYMKMLESESSIKSAEAMGRLSTGVLTMGAVFMNLENILDRVTGSPPEDPGKRAAWEATGKKAFSVRFGDKWHSYQRLDPFATTLGIMADITHGWADMRKDGISEYGDEDEFEEKQAAFAQMAGVLATSFANNVSNKSYIENLGELLDVLEKPPEAFANVTGNVLGGFVPNGLNWSQNVFQEEPAIMEARGILDKMKKRFPESIRPGKKLMPRRNGFGEVMRKSKETTGDIRQDPSALIKGLNPIFSSDVSNDIIDIETEHQAVGRQAMSDGRQIRGERISYRSYRNELGDTAYDRMQELSGSMKLGPRQLTLRQALRATIESDDYQNLPPVTESNRHRDHPRSKALTRIINVYRAAARRQATSEFPKLRADLAELLR